MDLPFTVDQFFQVFSAYNDAIWPWPIIAYGLGFLTVVLAFVSQGWADRAVAAVLALFWTGMGWLYHLVYFSEINRLAYVFGFAFLVQAVVLLVYGVFRHGLSFGYRSGVTAWVGAAFIVYAGVVYEAWGYLAGHGLMNAPLFGVAPCPTTIFTIGMLMWTVKPVPKPVLVIPVLWSLIGASAAVLLEVPQDVVLLVAGVLGPILIVWRDRRGMVMQARLGGR